MSIQVDVASCFLHIRVLRTGLTRGESDSHERRVFCLGLLWIISEFAEAQNKPGCEDGYDT